MSDKLKPCPFCGGEAKLIHEKSFGYKVWCIECLIQYPWTDEKQYAITLWNNRPAPHKYTVEELRELGRKPVYCIFNNDIEPLWGMNNPTENEVDMICEFVIYDDYGIDWTAYDRELEREVNEKAEKIFKDFINNY